MTDQALSIDSIIAIVWLKITISTLTGTLLIGIGGFAVTMAALGFHDLNKTLWSR